MGDAGSHPNEHLERDRVFHGNLFGRAAKLTTGPLRSGRVGRSLFLAKVLADYVSASVADNIFRTDHRPDLGLPSVRSGLRNDRRWSLRCNFDGCLLPI